MDVCQAGFSGIIQNVCEILFWRYVTASITMTYLSDSFSAFVYFIER